MRNGKTRPVHSRWLSLGIPVIQAFAVLFVLLAKHWNISANHEQYLSFGRNIVRALNFPLVLISAPVLLGLDHISQYLPTASGVWFAIGVAVVGTIIVVGVFVFWYVVVREITMRRTGQSLMQQLGKHSSLAVALASFVIAIGAFWNAFTDQRVRLLLNLGATKIGIFLTCLPDAILIGWGVLLLTVSVQLLVRRQADSVAV